MTSIPPPTDHFRAHAYVDAELTVDEVADFERMLVDDPDAMAEVAALRRHKRSLHAHYDAFLDPAPGDAALARRFGRSSSWLHTMPPTATRWALAATVVLAAAIGAGGGWFAREQVRADERPSVATSNVADVAERRLQAFVEVASVSHAVFVPEVRHPVEVTAADEAHLVAWLSKRLDAPLVVPHLGDAGWDLLGGRLLPADHGPVAQFMYQDRSGRRLTLAVSKGVVGTAAPAASNAPSTSFRIAEERGSTMFYWIDRDYAYALTGKLPRSEMTALASRVHRQLDR